MKKIAIILTCMLACLALFAGCTDKKDSDNQNLPNSVEIDAEGKPGTDAALLDGFTYSFKDLDNADGIVVTPRKYMPLWTMAEVTVPFTLSEGG